MLQCHVMPCLRASLQNSAKKASNGLKYGDFAALLSPFGVHLYTFANTITHNHTAHYRVCLEGGEYITLKLHVGKRGTESIQPAL